MVVGFIDSLELDNSVFSVNKPCNFAFPIVAATIALACPASHAVTRAFSSSSVKLSIVME